MSIEGWGRPRAKEVTCSLLRWQRGARSAPSRWEMRGRKEEGKKKKEKLKNIPVQRGYFGIFIYYLKKKKAEMRAEAPRPALVWMGTGCAWRGMLQSWLPAVF